jgi:outer membrane immunogenic protein
MIGKASGLTLLGSLAIIAGGAWSARAADLPAQPYTKAPVVVPAPTWTGFYVGANVGGAWGHSDPRTSTVFSVPGYFAPTSVPAVNAAGVQSLDKSGVIGGIQAGYNWQLGSFLAGVEADIQSMSLKGTATTNSFYPLFPAGLFSVSSSVSTNWLATVRGRVGLTQGGWLFYVTGGAAFSDLKATWAFADNCGAVAGCNGPGAPNASEAATASSTKVGWTAGAGVEAKFYDRWSWKAEYLHVDLGSVSATGFINPATLAFFGIGPTANPFSHSANLTVDIGRVGINYAF